MTFYAGTINHGQRKELTRGGIIWLPETPIILLLLKLAVQQTVSLFQQGACSRVWRLPQEWNIENLTSIVKRSPSQMYWGCFSWHGVGPLIKPEGSVTAAAYVGTLQEFFLPELEQFLGSNTASPIF